MKYFYIPKQIIKTIVMKKIININLLFCLLFFCPLKAEHVDTTLAKTVAKNFYLSRIKHVEEKSIQEIQLKMVYQKNTFLKNGKSIVEIPIYYVFNVENNNGFIIVAADDNVIPILGYSLKGKYFIDNQPPAFIEWMKGYEKQIKYTI